MRGGGASRTRQADQAVEPCVGHAAPPTPPPVFTSTEAITQFRTIKKWLYETYNDVTLRRNSSVLMAKVSQPSFRKKSKVGISAFAA